MNDLQRETLGCIDHKGRPRENCPYCTIAQLQISIAAEKERADAIFKVSQIPWNHRNGSVDGVDGCVCIACELHRVYAKELATLRAENERLKERETRWDAALAQTCDEQAATQTLQFKAEAELDSLRAKLQTAQEALMKLTIASCTCLTKTPETEYHNPDCRYRIAAEALQALNQRDK